MSSERDLIVGGQAVIEGVMMRTPSAYAIAVRRADGAIVQTSAKMPRWSDRYKLLGPPVIRGGAVLIQSMGLGIKALNYSANAAFEDAEAAAPEVELALQPAVADGDAAFATVPSVVKMPSASKTKKAPKRGRTAAATSSLVFAIVFNILLFVVAPLLLTNALFIGAGWAHAQDAAQSAQASQPAVQQPSSPVSHESWFARASRTVKTYLRPVRPSVAFNLIDGVIRMTFFIVMIFSFSLIKDIRRVFEYHGAEHKTVFNWESGLPLTIENARVQPRQHPRCGTSFLMVVMLVAIILFSVIKFDSLLLNMAVRIALLPLVAGISYEIIRLSARKEGSAVFRLITRPGVWLQNITTKEPDDSQLEVAIEALKASLLLEPEHGAAATA